MEDYGPMKKAAGTYFPLGLGYISTYVKQYGYDVHMFDPNVQDISLNDMIECVNREKPLLVGISFMTPQFYAAKNIVDAIKRSCPSVKILLGGAHPSVMPKETMNEIENADFLSIGEGERTTVELLDYLSENKGGLSEIRGLAWRDNKGCVVNTQREPIEDLDGLGFPDRGLIDQSLYRQQSFLSYSKNAKTIYTSRGCPGRCVFCASGFKLKRKVRMRSIKNIFDEIDMLVKDYKMDYLLIKDDTFTLSRSRIRMFCEELIKRKYNIKWHCMCRVDTLDEETLSLMKKAGLNDVLLGIESGNNEILKNIKKNISVEDVKKTVCVCDRLGIKTYGSFILGLPGDGYGTIEDTIRFACALPLTIAAFFILTPYPGTEVFVYHCRYEKGKTLDYRKFISSTGLHFVKEYDGMAGVRPEELPAMVSGALRRFYLRPGQMIRIIKALTPSMAMGICRAFFALIKRELYISRK